MTKEKLFNKLLGYGSLNEATLTSILEPFFDSNVCIPRGENRHPYADVLHEWFENITVPLQYERDGKWYTDYPFGTKTVYRIKPSEPVFEWQYCHDNCAGKNIVADKYYTDHEYETMVDDKEHCIKLPWTKRVRND